MGTRPSPPPASDTLTNSMQQEAHWGDLLVRPYHTILVLKQVHLRLMLIHPCAHVIFSEEHEGMN